MLVNLSPGSLGSLDQQSKHLILHRVNWRHDSYLLIAAAGGGGGVGVRHFPRIPPADSGEVSRRGVRVRYGLIRVIRLLMITAWHYTVVLIVHSRAVIPFEAEMKPRRLPRVTVGLLWATTLPKTPRLATEKHHISYLRRRLTSTSATYCCTSAHGARFGVCVCRENHGMNPGSGSFKRRCYIFFLQLFGANLESVSAPPFPPCFRIVSRHLVCT